MQEDTRKITMEAVEFVPVVNNGIIEIPPEYRKDYSTGVRVILMRNNDSKTSGNEPDMREKQERIATAERLVGIASKNAMTLDEIRNERLARQ